MQLNWKYIIFITAFSLIAFEVLLRAFGTNDTYMESIGKEYYSYWGKKQKGWYHTNAPNITYTEKNIDFTYTSETNSLGYRELEPEQLFNDHSLRVVVLGDSYTEGLGVVYDSSFVRHLQRMLRSRQIPVSLFNAGNAGSDPLFAYSILRDKLTRYHPDIVIEMINTSDYTDFIYRGGFERFRSDSTTSFKQGPWFESLYHYCYIFRFLLHDLGGYAQGDLFMKEKEFMNSCEATNHDLVTVADSFQVLALKNDFKVLHVIHSGCAELVNDNEINRFSKQVMQKLTDDLKTKGYMAVNIWEPMAQVINQSNQLVYGFKHDGHFSSAGYKVMAQSIFEETEKNYPGFWDARTGK